MSLLREYRLSNINSIEVHPPLNNNRHDVDGAFVAINSLWLILFYFENDEFGKERGEGKKIIQVRCKIHTLNENHSMVMYPLNT